MGNSPTREKETIDGPNARLPFCTSSMQGWRENQEDSHISETKLSEKLHSWAMFAVFDGHAGELIAKQVGQRLIGVFLSQPYIKNLTDQNDYNIEKVKEAITNAFIQLDKTLQEELETRRTNANEATDEQAQEYSRESLQDSGCTATVCIITDKHFFFVNSGDSRQVLVRHDADWDRSSSYKYKRFDNYQKWIDSETGLQSQLKYAAKRKADLRGIAEHKLGPEIYDYPEISKAKKREDHLGYFFDFLSTIDHKPDDEQEKARITGKAKGVVHYGRVDGNLAVSRAFGDFELKKGPYDSQKKTYLELTAHETKVTVVPHIEVLERDASQDAYLILGCDGIFDAIFNDDLVSFITYRMMVGDTLKELVENGLEFALKLNSRDNLSLTVVKLDKAPTVDNVMKVKEEKLNKQFLNQIEALLNWKEFDRADQIVGKNGPIDKIFRECYLRDRNRKSKSKKRNDKDQNYSYFEHIFGKNYIFPYGMVMKCDLPQALMCDEHYGAAMTKSLLIHKYLKDGPDEFRSPKYQEFEAIGKKEEAERKAKEAKN